MEKKTWKAKFPAYWVMVYVTESDETYNPNVGIHVLAHMYAHSTVLVARSHF